MTALSDDSGLIALREATLGLLEEVLAGRECQPLVAGLDVRLEAADLAAQIAELLGCDEVGLPESEYGSTRAASPPRAGRPLGRV